jgi:hypothetical protein
MLICILGRMKKRGRGEEERNGQGGEYEGCGDEGEEDQRRRELRGSRGQGVDRESCGEGRITGGGGEPVGWGCWGKAGGQRKWTRRQHKGYKGWEWSDACWGGGSRRGYWGSRGDM